MLSPDRAVARSASRATRRFPGPGAAPGAARRFGQSSHKLLRKPRPWPTARPSARAQPLVSESRPWPKYEIPKHASRLEYALPSAPSGKVTVAWTSEYLFVEDDPGRGRRALKPATLRDGCSCTTCRDPASGNKMFSSTEIADDIGIAFVRATHKGLGITFSNDIERLARHGHEMMLSWSSVEMALHRRRVQDEPLPRMRSILSRTGLHHWDGRMLERHVDSVDYDEYMQGGEAFWHAIINICRLGIVYLRNVPRREEAVVDIATRIANIRETFYGRTFDVRVKPDADNIACTNAPLCLHQDLLYLDAPPMIQILHCMDNSCDGGESLFSDADRIGSLLFPFCRVSAKMAPLADHFVPYHYHNAGYHYFASRYVLDQNEAGFSSVYWSPPFQGRCMSPAKDMRPWIAAARVFERLVQAPDALYRRRLEPGECVIFNNLRLLHGRTAFDVARGGSRWLRGAYIAADDFQSRASGIPLHQAEAYRAPVPWLPEQDEDKELWSREWHRQVLDAVRDLDPAVEDWMVQDPGEGDVHGDNEREAGNIVAMLSGASSGGDANLSRPK